MTSGGEWFLNVSTNKGGVVEPNVTYLAIGKIVSAASTSDEVSMAVYGPSDSLPATEPETWLLTSQINSAALLQNIRLVVGGGTQGEFDEIRIGSTYESVTDPDAAVGAPGELKNVLSVYWAEEVVTPGPLPEDPPVITYVNHLEFGTTPLQATTWYHFALTYDGADLRWYLDGQLDGQVLAPPITSVGTAKIVLANNRMTGANDRGFYGLLDEIRIWDKVLAPSEMLVNGGLPGSNLLWRSRFETQLGQPVTSGQTADTINCFDNSVGQPSQRIHGVGPGERPGRAGGHRSFGTRRCVRARPAGRPEPGDQHQHPQQRRQLRRRADRPRLLQYVPHHSGRRHGRGGSPGQHHAVGLGRTSPLGDWFVPRRRCSGHAYAQCALDHLG
jgi:hypothetical protein